MLLIKSMNRFQAFGWHLSASVCVVALVATIIFLKLYPQALAYASGVGDIFLLLILVDIVLGPTFTLIIFNPQKKAAELKRDVAIILAIQLAALLYGLITLFIARPVYMVFNAGQFDLVYANEISVENLAKASQSEYLSLPYFGPEVIAAQLPNDPEKAEAIVYNAVYGNGEDIQHMPEYYLAYEKQKDAVLKQLRPLEKLKSINKNQEQEVETLIKKYSLHQDGVGYLPLKGKSFDVIVIVSRTAAEVLEINSLSPY